MKTKYTKTYKSYLSTINRRAAKVNSDRLFEWLKYLFINGRPMS